jgi:nitrite reductase (NADH) small subunit
VEILDSSIPGMWVKVPQLAAPVPAPGRATAPALGNRPMRRTGPGPRTVCRLSDLVEGRGTLVRVAGREIALFRLGDEVLAVDNACPHRGGPLAFGDQRGAVVHCPVHAWPFHLRTGRCAEVPGASVRTYRVRVRGDRVRVEL